MEPAKLSTDRAISLLGLTIGFAAAMLIATEGVASATLFGGGGSSKKDCVAVFDAPVNKPASKPKRIRCTDGDPTCDADATVNGVCQFPVSVCANSTFDPRCSSPGIESAVVDHAIDVDDPDFDPEFQALQTRIDNEIAPPNNTADECTLATNLTVRVRGPFAGNKCKKGKKTIRVDAESTFDPMTGSQLRDKDKLKMQCLPAPDMCDPQIFFSGTFDRIQKQIFDVGCATQGCHTSEGLQGNLTLEDGSAYIALVNVDPENGVAMAAGWKRVLMLDAMTGDPDMSYLYRKITGELDPGMGERMPFGKPALKADQVELIRLWILNGAPETGWVPGTF